MGDRQLSVDNMGRILLASSVALLVLAVGAWGSLESCNKMVFPAACQGECTPEYGIVYPADKYKYSHNIRSWEDCAFLCTRDKTCAHWSRNHRVYLCEFRTAQYTKTKKSADHVSGSSDCYISRGSVKRISHISLII